MADRDFEHRLKGCGYTCTVGAKKSEHRSNAQTFLSILKLCGVKNYLYIKYSPNALLIREGITL